MTQLPDLEFVPYGLSSRWRGPRILERWSQRGGQTDEVALGHGLRWALDEPWLEVATFGPTERDLADAEIWEGRVMARLEMEHQELAAIYGSGEGTPTWTRESSVTKGSIRVDDLDLETKVVSLRGISASLIESPTKLITIVIWSGHWTREQMRIEQMTNLTQYEVGLANDQERRLRLS
ncbi:MAG: hypothetical protein ACRDWY_09480 [Actinomycetes bacterium]